MTELERMACELRETREVLAAIILQLGGACYLNNVYRVRINRDTQLILTRELDGGMMLTVDTDS